MAMTTSSSMSEKAEEFTTEDTENTEDDANGLECVFWTSKLGADRWVARFVRESLDGWVDGVHPGKNRIVFWLGVISRMI